jgi:hypothetical protein
MKIYLFTISFMILFNISINSKVLGMEDDNSSPVKKNRGYSHEKMLTKKFHFHIAADRVTVINALPEGQSGAEIKKKLQFAPTTKFAQDGLVILEIGHEPIWIIEGDLPEEHNLKLEDSPFGFHPAAQNYDFAKEIGVDWDRGGMYLMWTAAQPDLNVEKYDWKVYDEYFLNFPDGMRTLKNITISMGKPLPPDDRKRRVLDRRNSTRRTLDRRKRKTGRSDPERENEALRRYLYFDGTSYRPSDSNAYFKWVKAAVERYDGDGIDDMPGLRIPVKHWQVDNEPNLGSGREGFADLMRITSKAIKESDPDAKVLQGGMILPSLLSYRNSTKKVFEKAEHDWYPMFQELNGEAIDIIDLHWFGVVGEWKIFPEVLKIFHNKMKDYSFNDAPIWITEMGVYSGNPKGRSGTPIKEGSERKQASEMVKRYVVAIAEGVEKIFWAWGMYEGFGDPNDNDFFDTTGFVYDGIGPSDPGKGIKKISYWTYQKMTKVLKHWDGSRPEKIKTEKGIYAYRFKFNKNGNKGIIVAWKSP